MIYVAPWNIYLCDLEYLGARVEFLDEGGKTREVRVEWIGRPSYRLMVEESPQGWHAKRGIDMDMGELAEYMEMRLEPRENFPYLCFMKIREGKLLAVRLLRIAISALAILWMYRWIMTGAWQYPIMSALSAGLFLVTLYLPKELLKKTYADYLRDVEEDVRNGGPGPLEIHDWFND